MAALDVFSYFSFFYIFVDLSTRCEKHLQFQLLTTVSIRPPQETNNEGQSVSVVAMRSYRVTVHTSASPGQKPITSVTVSQEFGR